MKDWPFFQSKFLLEGFDAGAVGADNVDHGGLVLFDCTVPEGAEQVRIHDHLTVGWESLKRHLRGG